jgi:uncharacterized protein (DUF2126 family)/transglutaminase-like putative cysteine protease
MQVAVRHHSRYSYARAVALGPQLVQLRPAPHCRTAILSYSLEVTPADRLLSWQFDPLANHVARVIFPGRTNEFVVDVKLVAELAPVNPFDFVMVPGAATMPFEYAEDVARDLEPYLLCEEPGPLLEEFVGSLAVQGQPTVSFLVGLNARLRDEIGYTTRFEHGVQSCEETLELGTGSCRDTAWLLVQLCRQLGLAARFVSGYLVQLANEDDPTSPAEDSADLHAWAEVYLPGAGWIGMDPTSGLLTAEGHIPLACSTTATGAAPISGTVEAADVEFAYTVTVERLNEAPRLSKPFSDAGWEQVRAVAHHVDRDLKSQDVRLTMGGEPTFVGMDEAESPQWNIEALGPLKRRLGLKLIEAMRGRIAEGALLHLGQGKWYPNEPLPRWAFHCVSRVDGVPVWEDGGLFALEERDYGFEAGDAREFLEALTRRLGAGPQNILAAFEPYQDEDGADVPAGFVLPLRRRQPKGELRWSSQLWFGRPERFVLSAGDSPIGFRIPVEMMPFVAPDVLEHAMELDAEGKPTARAKLAEWPARRPELFGQTPEADPLPAVSVDPATAPELIRPSLCVQVREGRLYVFLPYVPVLADFLDLVAAVEETAQHLAMPVWVEGYSAPADPRMHVFSLTPDPGVLEVNLPPTSDWDEMEALNAVLAEEAHKQRLIAGKFAYDGTHQATGGGSHITVGGPSLEESPILRRPDLLRSMVTFWQNHPSLSYLFSGMYVGPTSQYPRVDEARVDCLYELEVAFAHLPAEGCAPFIVDGLFRNLLVDVTGNSHRAEFCIDKLFPPQGQGQRWGLLELRAFEMAPHYRMDLLQTLLVRALVCAFWKRPFVAELVRWGAALHDRFMLPHFVEQDFYAVLGHLRQAGYGFQDAWFAAQMEFRFPRIGKVSAEGVTLELRQALEPWNVLAEETTASGTGRSVDSSLERMQVKVTGLADGGRYVVSCNGRRVPLHPTGEPGEAIAGIRYRARRLFASLHPTVPVHTPLTFDVLEAATGRSVARCTYYSAAPDGSVYTARPANAAEARARRLARFVVSAPPAEVLAVPVAEVNVVYPMTLDMRWPVGGDVAGVSSGISADGAI